MSLSFREAAAIAYIRTCSDERAVVTMAQTQADACCAAWGHDYVVWRGENGNGRTVWIADECVRCGAKK